MIKGEQDDLKMTVMKQNDLIYKMQEEFKLLVRHNEKIYKVQELHTIKIQELEGKIKEERSRDVGREYGKREVPYHASNASYPV